MLPVIFNTSFAFFGDCRTGELGVVGFVECIVVATLFLRAFKLAYAVLLADYA